MARECDNDDCDYETSADDSGRPRVRWVHVGDCGGLRPFEPPYPGDIPPGSFLEYLKGIL